MKPRLKIFPTNFKKEASFPSFDQNSFTLISLNTNDVWEFGYTIVLIQ